MPPNSDLTPHLKQVGSLEVEETRLSEMMTATSITLTEYFKLVLWTGFESAEDAQSARLLYNYIFEEGGGGGL